MHELKADYTWHTGIGIFLFLKNTFNTVPYFKRYKIYAMLTTSDSLWEILTPPVKPLTILCT